MNDDNPVAVPLTDQLHSIPLDAVLRIDTPNALGCMDTRSIPVGRLCHEAAETVLRLVSIAKAAEKAQQALAASTVPLRLYHEYGWPDRAEIRATVDDALTALRAALIPVSPV